MKKRIIFTAVLLLISLFLFENKTFAQNPPQGCSSNTSGSCPPGQVNCPGTFFCCPNNSYCQGATPYLTLPPGVPPSSDKRIDFQQIIKDALPDYGQSKKIIDITDFEQPLANIFSALLPFIFIIAGLLLGVYLIIGGFEFLTSGGSEDKIASAKSKITNALTGFVIIFAAYWLAQILEIIFGIGIL